MEPAPSGAILTAYWQSGVYPGDGIDLASANAFSHYVGRPLDNVRVFPEPSSWHEIADDTWEVRQYTGFPGRLIVDLPLLPSNGDGTLREVAAGEDDAYFLSMLHNLVSLGRGDSVLVLGSEFNGNWQTYSAYDPAAYIAAFRHVAGLIRSTHAGFTIDWTGNAIDNQCGHDPFTELYPGDDVVDIVGVDAYDYAESRISQDGFAHWADQPFGLQAWLDFAVQHHKPFSLPEWGLTPADSHWGSPTALGSGDDPDYIRGMFQFLQRNALHVAFEDYFNRPTGRSLDPPVQVPESSEVYQSLWSRIPSIPPLPLSSQPVSPLSAVSPTAAPTVPADIGPQPGAGQSDDGGHASLRMVAADTKVSPGSRVALHGRVVATPPSGLQLVTVQRRLTSDHWKRVRQVRTSASGKFHTAVKVHRTAEYRAVLRHRKSKPVRVEIRHGGRPPGRTEGG